MKYVLNGVETNNKGAEIMLYAILQEIERRDKDAVVYLCNIPQGTGYIDTSLKIKQKPVWNIRRIISKIPYLSLAIGLSRLSYFLRDVYSVGKIDYFLDGSGFCISDKWNTTNQEVRDWTTLLRKSKRDGAKIIFLPQGFGPIEQENNKKLLSTWNKYGDLIISRDRLSYKYIEDTRLADMNKVKLYTDFTSLVEGVYPEGYEHLKGAVCIIPNVRMLDMGTGITWNEYLKFVEEIVKTVKGQGHKVYLLNHEGSGDESLAYKFQKALGGDIEVVTGLKGVNVKGIISEAHLVITSRFHGVASALNSCVPCLSTSWSHKYSELYKDYGLEDGVLPIKNVNESVARVKQYLDDNYSREIRNKLSIVVPKIKEETQQMWKEVWSA